MLATDYTFICEQQFLNKYNNKILSKYSSDGGDRTDGVDTSDGGDENLNL